MSKLYFTRHGQTIWNVEGKVCGATDIELTELGHKQAIELGERIKADKNIKIDEIVASPLIRAKNTAEHISEITGIPMHTDMRVIEQNFGKYEGGGRRSKEFSEARNNFVYSFDGGESMLKVASRVYNILDEIKKDKDKTYLIVAHNGIARIVNSYFKDMANEDFAAYAIKNCELLCYEFKNTNKEAHGPCII